MVKQKELEGDLYYKKKRQIGKGYDKLQMEIRKWNWRADNLKVQEKS